MEKDNSFTVSPNHATPVGFWHDICQSCSYENSFFDKDDDKRIKECRSCMENSLKYYNNRKPVTVLIDENGRHIIRSYE